jgi:hypothetical protein
MRRLPCIVSQGCPKTGIETACSRATSNQVRSWPARQRAKPINKSVRLSSHIHFSSPISRTRLAVRHPFRKRVPLRRLLVTTSKLSPGGRSTSVRQPGYRRRFSPATLGFAPRRFRRLALVEDVEATGLLSKFPLLKTCRVNRRFPGARPSRVKTHLHLDLCTET